MILLSRLWDFSMMQVKSDHIQRRFGFLWIGMLVYVGGLLGAYSMGFSCCLTCLLSMIEPDDALLYMTRPTMPKPDRCFPYANILTAEMFYFVQTLSN